MYLPADVAGVGPGTFSCVDVPCVVVPSMAPYIKLAVLPSVVTGYQGYTPSQPSALSMPLAVAAQTPTSALQVPPGTGVNMAATFQVTTNSTALDFPGQQSATTPITTNLPCQKTHSPTALHHSNDLTSTTTQLSHITTEGVLSHHSQILTGTSQFALHGGAGLLGHTPYFNGSSLPFRICGAKRKYLDDNRSDSGDSSGKSEILSESEREYYYKKLHCKVCRVTLNAPAQAKQHYEGKTHAKRVKLHSDVTSESTTNDKPSDDSSKDSSLSMPAKDLNPEIYCKVCAVSFNSSKQAQQHYGGKNHAKKLRASRRVVGRRLGRSR